MIRYHSAYSWHTYNAYEHLCNEKDAVTKEWVRKFNVFDLYTKSSDNKIDIDKVWPYYEALLNKYGLGGQLWW
jgi:inositol oxygenase